MSKVVFNAEVNPFTGEVQLATDNFEETLFFKGLDDWFGYEYDGEAFDFHYLYDEDGFNLTAYKVVNGQTDTSEEGQQIVNITIKY